MNPTTYRYTMMGLSGLLVLIAVGMVAVLPQMAQSPQTPGIDNERMSNDPKAFFKLPEFTLTDQNEREVGLSDLAGKVWVAEFVFTECRGICPALMGQMSQLHERLEGHPAGERIQLVSISVDPETDTPEVLREFGQQHGADFDRWTFLTGEREQIWSLIERGFRLPVEELAENEAMPIMHSERFVLVDDHGRTRGYYPVLEEGEMDRLVADLDKLVGE